MDYREELDEWERKAGANADPIVVLIRMGQRYGLRRLSDIGLPLERPYPYGECPNCNCSALPPEELYWLPDRVDLMVRSIEHHCQDCNFIARYTVWFNPLPGAPCGGDWMDAYVDPPPGSPMHARMNGSGCCVGTAALLALGLGAPVALLI